MLKDTVLILENDHYAEWALKTLLETEGYVGIGVDTLDGVFKEIRERELSGMITEYWIDHCCTLNVIRELKKIFPEAYVMMTTGEELAENRYEEIIKAGVDDYFLKPFSTRKILLHLKKGLRYRSLFLEKNRLERELVQFQTQRGAEMFQR